MQKPVIPSEVEGSPHDSFHGILRLRFAQNDPVLMRRLLVKPVKCKPAGRELTIALTLSTRIGLTVFAAGFAAHFITIPLVRKYGRSTEAGAQ